THVPESRFPDRFFLVRPGELAVGAAKARALLAKTDLAGDRLLALQTTAAGAELHPNLRTGLGRYVARPWVRVEGLAFVAADLSLVPVAVEDALAQSLRVLTPALRPFEELRPRSVSILAVARACQAACPFCFSR